MCSADTGERIQKAPSDLKSFITAGVSLQFQMRKLNTIQYPLPGQFPLLSRHFFPADIRAQLIGVVVG